MKKISVNSIFFAILFFSFLLNSCGRHMQNVNDSKVLIPLKDDPTISFRIAFKVGSQNDPKGKEGLAALTAEILTDGSTKINSYDKILDLLYPLASSYSSKVDKEITVIMGRTHKDNLKEYSNLLADAILNPAFSEEDFNRIKSQTIDYIEKELKYASDEELGKEVLYNSIFDGTPYAHLTEGTLESLNKITIQDVKDFYKKYYTKSNLIIALGGGYDENFVKEFESKFSILPTEKTEEISKPNVKKIDGLEFTIIDKDCDATAISFGFPISVLRGDDDFFALALFTSWFGEHRNSSSHLYQVIRELRGMNYGDYAYIETFLHGGHLQMPEPNNPRHQQIFEVWIRPVQHVNRLFAIRAALRELKNVVDNGMSNDNFEITKKFLMKYSLNYAQTTFDRLGYALDNQFYGIAKIGDYIDYFRSKIQALTLEQVNNAIKKHIQYNNIKFAVITNNAQKFKEDLVNNVPSPIQYATPKPQNILTEDKEIEKFPIKVSIDKISIKKVDDLFLK